MIVFWLSIFGMTCWGIAPIFAKLGLKNLDPYAGLVIRTLTASCFIIGFMGFRGASGVFEQFRTMPLKAWLFITIEALLATLIGDLAYYAAIKKGNVSIVATIMASSPLVTMLLSIIFLKEELNFYKILGAVLIIIGIRIVM